MSGHKIWIGGLPKGVKEIDVQEFLIQYAIGHGKLTDVQIRSSSRDIFAFATFASGRDADDAIRDLHQTEFLESNHFVKMARAENRDKRDGQRDVSERRDGSWQRDVRDRRTPPRGYDRSRSPSRRGDRRRDDSRGRCDYSNDRPFTIWMGGLPRNVREEEIEDFCRGYGRILGVRIRQSDRDVFAFVDLEDGKRAKECIKELDQKEWFGKPRQVIQVRESFTERPQKDFTRYKDREEPAPRLRPAANRFTIELKNLPPNMPWFELKDMAREIGNTVCYTSIFKRDGITCGVVEYGDVEDAHRLCDEFHGRRFSGYPDRVEAIRTWE